MYQLTCSLAHLDDSDSNKHLLDFIPIEGRSVDERVFLVIQFAQVTEDVIKVFALYVHATLSNGCVVHASIMGTCTRWKITKCDVINFMVRSLG